MNSCRVNVISSIPQALDLKGCGPNDFENSDSGRLHARHVPDEIVDGFLSRRRLVVLLCDR